jgi:tRNA (guanosine-2'-O-)-methyltransferase
MAGNEGLTEFLSTYVSDHKKALIEEVLSKRTRYITVVLENIYHAHNASAVVRSCECFGIQDLHVIEGHNEYEINPYVVRGSAKWVCINKYPQTVSDSNCYNQLKKKGYKLLGTTPDPHCISLMDLKVEGKIAFVLGTEETGLSDFAKEQMDDFVHIPMYGFTESFNLSVSAAICLYEVTNQLRQSKIDWQLSDNEKSELRLEWYRKVIAKSDVLEREYLRIRNN